MREFSGDELPILSPLDGSLLATERCATEADVGAALKRGRAAQEVWRKSSFAERRSLLADLNAYILEHQDEIVDISIKETGKSRMDAIKGEILPTCEKLRYISSEGEAAIAPEGRSVAALLAFVKKAWVQYHPLGVIGVIVPANFPFHNCVRFSLLPSFCARFLSHPTN